MLISKLKEYLKRPAVKEFAAYIFWGILSAVLNIGLYMVLISVGLEYYISNLIVLIIVRIFVFITNKYFVFHTHAENLFDLLKEIISFIFTRSLTALIDYFGLIFLIEVLSVHALTGKIFVDALVIALNYVFSKFLTFRKKNSICK